MANEVAVLSAIRRHVWAGTYGAEEIAWIVGEEFFEPGKADDDWLRTRIEEQFRQKRAEEAATGQGLRMAAAQPVGRTLLWTPQQVTVLVQ